LRRERERRVRSSMFDHTQTGVFFQKLVWFG
jgi:hypothetical protein